MAPWLRVLEAYLVQALLRTPAFHRGVEKVAKGVHRLRHGIPPDELGGTKIDGQTDGNFLRHFMDEVQTQLGRAEAKSENAVARTTRDAPAVSRKKDTRSGFETGKTLEEEGAEAAWRQAQQQASQAPKQGFLDEYMGALREQLKGGK